MSLGAVAAVRVPQVCACGAVVARRGAALRALRRATRYGAVVRHEADTKIAVSRPVAF